MKLSQIFSALSLYVLSVVTMPAWAGSPNVFALNSSEILGKYLQNTSPEANTQRMELTDAECKFFRSKPARNALKISEAPAIKTLIAIIRSQESASLVLSFSDTQELVQITFVPKKTGERCHTLEIQGAWQHIPTWLTHLASKILEVAENRNSSFGKTLKLAPLAAVGAYALSRWTISQASGEQELAELNRGFTYHENFGKGAQNFVFFVHGYSGDFGSGGCCGGNPSGYVSWEDAQNNFRPYRRLFAEKRDAVVEWGSSDTAAFSTICPGIIQPRRYASFAQKWDVFQVKKHLEALIARNRQNAPIICLGHSNGASTLLATLFEYPELSQHVNGVILLAPYADIGKLRLEPFISTAKYFPHSDTFVRRALQATVAPNYSCSGKSPLEWIATGTLRKDFPIVLLHAQDDEMIDLRHHEMIRNTLLEAGYTNMLTATPKHGGHFIWLKIGDYYDSLTNTYPLDAEHVQLTQNVRQFIQDQMLRKP